jgi:PTS system nitrogen regulatory IIA component
MRLIELLTQERVAIRHNEDGARSIEKAGVIKLLARMLASGAHVDSREVERVLSEREQLQSTGIGEGVAIPHGALASLHAQYATLLIVPEGVDFAAIDGLKVTILFAVIGPKRATGEHLKTLARVSRLLRNRAFRDRLVSASSAEEAYGLIVAEEGERP